MLEIKHNTRLDERLNATYDLKIQSTAQPSYFKHLPYTYLVEFYMFLKNLNLT